MLYDAFVLNDAASQKNDSEYPTYNDRVNVFHKELFRNALQCCIGIHFGITIAKISYSNVGLTCN